MQDCIFCKIVNGEIPSFKVYEDDETYAFLDISQDTFGHTLVVPKKHVQDVFTMQENETGFLTKIPKIARSLEKSLPNMLGLNIIANNKEFAYQSVMHSHFHLLPRYKEDGFSINFINNVGKHSNETLQEIANAIKENIENV